MRRLVLLLACLLWASSAQARHWYVATIDGTPPGVESSEGTTTGSPTTLNHANWGVVEGDIVHLAAGTYSDPIRPLCAGSADYGKITYVGTFGYPDTTFVPGIYFEQPYITVSGVTAYGLSTYYGVRFDAAHDSLDHVVMLDGMPSALATGDYFKIHSCTFASDTLDVIHFGEMDLTENPVQLVGFSVDSSTFTMRHTEGDWHVSGGAFALMAVNDYSIFDCTFNLSIGQAGAGGVQKMYNARNGRLTDVTFNITSDAPKSDYSVYPPTSICDECNSTHYRDYTRNNRFLRCHWNWSGNSANHHQYLASASGTTPNTTRNNTWYECTFRSTVPHDSPLMWFQNGMRRDTVAYCAFISTHTPAIGLFNGVGDSAWVYHNTFIRLSPDTVAAGYSGNGNSEVLTGDTWTGKPTIRDNIFYSKRHPGVDSLITGSNGRGASAFTSDTLIAGGVEGHADNLDYNLWYTTNGADSAIYITYEAHRPGAGQNLCTDHSVECHGLYGDPLFVGGTPTIANALTFDARLTATSPAKASGTSGSDIGAYVYEAVGDTFTITYDAGTGGTIACPSCNVDGSGNLYQRVPYDSCTAYQAVAVPNAHYSFTTWSDGYDVDLRTAGHDCNVRRDTTYVASFVIDSFTVAYTAGTGGSIYPPAYAYQRVAYGEDAHYVIGTPSTGYHFVRWLPDSLSTAMRTDTTIVADTAYTATFGINTYLQAFLAGSGGSIVGSATQWVAHGSNCSAVTARANTGYHFTRWSDGRTDSTRADSNIVANKVVVASFAINSYTLTYTAGSGGAIVGTSPQTVNYGGNGTTVTATPSDGYAFYSWSDSLKTASRRDTLVSADVNVTAMFNATSTADPGIRLTIANATFNDNTLTFTIENTGTTDLHVWSVTLYHIKDHVARVVSCTKSASTATIAASATQDVTLSSIVLRSRLLPDYRVTVTSDAGRKSLALTYDPCR